VIGRLLRTKFIHLDERALTRMSSYRQRLRDQLSAKWVDRKHVDVVLIIIAILGTELLLYFGRNEVALWLYFAELFAILLYQYVSRESATVLTALGLLPLFRLVNLAMPAFTETNLYWLPLVYGAFLPSVYLVSRSTEAVRYDFDPQLTLLGVIPAAMFGAGLGAIESSLLGNDALISVPSVEQVLVLAIVMFGFVGVVEEFLFRGVIQQTLQSRVGRWGGIGLTAALFGVMYAAPHSGAPVTFGIILGLVLGYVFDRTHNLVFVCTIHGSLNMVLYGLFPFYGTILG
jgi:membrane protease YdiL (CAAX protease family)